MYWVENIWTHSGFHSDSYAEACFFAQFDMDYVVVDRMSMQHIIL